MVLLLRMCYRARTDTSFILMASLLNTVLMAKSSKKQRVRVHRHSV